MAKRAVSPLQIEHMEILEGFRILDLYLQILAVRYRIGIKVLPERIRAR